MPGKLPKFRRFSGHLAGRTAKAVWVCSNLNCETHHEGTFNPETGKRGAPRACVACGGMAFDFFQTKVEAARWAELRLQEKLGAITGLRKQVRYPLYASDPNGLRVQVAYYVADFVWVGRDGRTTIEDVKPRKGVGNTAGVDNTAALKLKWMAAQGQPVSIHIRS